MLARLTLKQKAILDWLATGITDPGVDGACLVGGTGEGKSHTLVRFHRELCEMPGFAVGAARFEGLADPPLYVFLAAIGEAMTRWFVRSGASPSTLLDGLRGERLLLSRAFVDVATAYGDPFERRSLRSRGLLEALEESAVRIERVFRDQPELFEELFCCMVARIVARAAAVGHPVRVVLVFDQIEFAARRARSLLGLTLRLPPASCFLLLSLNESEIALEAPWPDGLSRLQVLELRKVNAEEGREIYDTYDRGRTARAERDAAVQDTSLRPLELQFRAWAARFRARFDPKAPFSYDHVRQLLAILTEEARDLLGILAIVPSPLPLDNDELATLLDLDPAIIDALAQSCIKQGLLERFPRALVFPHRRIKETVIESISEEQMCILGQRIAHFLEQHYQRILGEFNHHPGLTAYHAAVDLTGNISVWQRTAAILSEGWYRLEEWELARDRAEALSSRVVSLPPAEEARLQNLLGMTSYRLGHLDDAATAFERALPRAHQAGEPALVQLIRSNQSSVLLDRDDVATARRLLRDCLEETAEGGGASPLQSHIWRQMAAIERRVSNPEGALKALSRAVDAADLERFPLEAVEAKEAMAGLLAEYGRPDFGAAYLRQALDIARKLESTEKEAHIDALLAMLADDNTELADRHWRRALKVLEAKAIGHADWCLVAQYYSRFLIASGRSRAALELLLQGLELAEEWGLSATYARLANEIALLYESLGELENALSASRESVRLRQRMGSPRDLAVGYNNLGTLLFANGELDAALEYFEQSLDIWRQEADVRGKAMLFNNIAMLQETRGNLEKAMSAYRNSLTLKNLLRDPTAARQTLSNMVVFLDQIQQIACAQEYMRTLVEMDRGIDHPDLALEEAFLISLERRKADNCGEPD